MRASPLVRTLVSYLPSRSVLGLRRLADVPNWMIGRPHDVDYEALRHFVPAHPKVIDVGANRGQAIVSLSRVLRRPRIWSFEPNPDLARYLSRRFSSKEVVVLSHGLGARAESVTLFVPKYGHTVWDTRASLAEEEAQRHLNADQFWRYSEDRVAIEKVDVDIRTLDEFDLAPDILKIDVEGTEAAVIKGGMTTIETHLPVILLEGDAVHSASLLSVMGYRIHRFEPNRGRLVVGESGSLNTFLLRPDHYQLFAGLEVSDGP